MGTGTQRQAQYHFVLPLRRSCARQKRRFMRLLKPERE
nr:MAG TPA: hypothetical protein [Caudoviricetes sp.]